MSAIIDPRAGRHYRSTPLPTLQDGLPLDQSHELLLALYGQVCASWRLLTDVRFKLLGFLPVLSGVGILTLVNSEAAALPRVALAVLGLAVVAGLYIYDRRNSELYDDLISRGRKIEEELGVDTGHFRGRRNPATAWVNHSNGTRLVYGASLAGWLLALIAVLLG